MKVNVFNGPDPLKFHDPHAPEKPRTIPASLGGSGSVQQAGACAETRLRVAVEDADRLDEAALEQAGVRGITRLSEGVIHLLVDLNADQYAAEMRAAVADQSITYPASLSR